MDSLPLEVLHRIYLCSQPPERRRLLQAVCHRPNLRPCFTCARAWVTGGTLPALPTGLDSLAAVTVFCTKDQLYKAGRRCYTSILKSLCRVSLTVPVSVYRASQNLADLVRCGAVEIGSIEHIRVYCCPTSPLASNPFLTRCQDITALHVIFNSTEKTLDLCLPDIIRAQLEVLVIEGYDQHSVSVLVPTLPQLLHLKLVHVRASFPSPKSPFSGLPSLQKLTLEEAHVEGHGPEDIVHEASSCIEMLSISYAHLGGEDVDRWLDVQEDNCCATMYLDDDAGEIDLELIFSGPAAC